MLTYLSIDETLMVWCLVSGFGGFILGVVANGLRKGPEGDTYIYDTPRDAWADRKNHGQG